MGLVPYERGSGEEAPTPFHHVRTRRGGACREPGRGPSPEGNHAGAMISDSPASGTAGSRFLLFMGYPVCGIFL